MKNDDQQTPCAPTLAEAAGFQNRMESPNFSEFNAVDTEKDLIEGPNGLETRLLVLVVVVLVIAALLLMVTKTPPTALVAIGWSR